MRNALVLLLLFAAPAICVHAEARVDTGRVEARSGAVPRGAHGSFAGVDAAEGTGADGAGAVARGVGAVAGAGAVAPSVDAVAGAEVPAAGEAPSHARPADRGDLVRASLGSAAYAGIALVWIVGVGVALRRGRRAGPRRSG